MRQTIAERVAAGTAFLDREMPGWDRVIDLDRLTIASPCTCILGQLHVAPEDEHISEYETGLLSLSLDELEADQFGFNGVDASLDALTVEWRRVISARRESVTA